MESIASVAFLFKTLRWKRWLCFVRPPTMVLKWGPALYKTVCDENLNCLRSGHSTSFWDKMSSSLRRNGWYNWPTGDVCVLLLLLLESWWAVSIYTESHRTGNLAVGSRLKSLKISETGNSSAWVPAHASIASYSSWRKNKQPQERPWGLRQDTSGGGVQE